MTIALDLAAALDPVQFARRLGFEPDPWQCAVLRSTDPRLALCCSRQVGKSTTSAFRALHTAIFEAGSTVLMVGPSQRQAQELFRTALALYRQLGRPVAAEAENALSLVLENGSRIVSLPGDERTIRGFGAVRLVIIDEAARVTDDLMAALRPMVAVSGGQILALSTPFGRRGWFYVAATDPAAGWQVITVTATECPRITEDFLTQERETLGDWTFRQEYLCEFVDAVSAYFSGEDIAAMFSADVEPLGPDSPGPQRRLQAVPA